jgi:ribosome biogenesis protein ERB1
MKRKNFNDIDENSGNDENSENENSSDDDSNIELNKEKKENLNKEEEDVYLSDDFENDDVIESDFEFNSDGEDEKENIKVKGVYEDKKGLFKDVNDSDDSSEDENDINTIGNVPLHWYEEYDHIGYTRDGKKIMRKKQKDSLDEFIQKQDDPNYL